MSELISSEARSSVRVADKLRELSTLAEMNKEIHSTMNLNKLLQILVEKTIIGVNFERGLIYLVEENFLRCVAWLDRVKRERASIIKKVVGFKMDEVSIEVLAVKKGKTIYVEDATADKRVSRKFLRFSDTKEYCAVPLIGRNSVLGVLTGDKSYKSEPISHEDIKTLELFAGHISLAIENAKLYEEKDRFGHLLERKVIERTSELAQINEELSKKVNELSTLYEVSQLLNKSLEINEILDQMLSMIQQLGYNMCSIHILKEGKPISVFCAGLDKEYEKFIGIPLIQTMSEKEVFSSKPLIVHDVNNSNIVPIFFRDYFQKKRIQSFLLAPMLFKGKLIAVITIYSLNSDVFGEDETKFFSAFAGAAAISLENAFVFQKVIEKKDHIETISKNLERENIYLREKIKSEFNNTFVIGKSPSIRKVMDLVYKVADTSATVIIYGETGTGKELIANIIHELSPRGKRALIKVNCAAIPEELIESELFGHEKGAFTGAYEKRIGRFELAQGGTIFLDEIGDLSLNTQTKLLRVLQEQEIQRLGSGTPIKVDVRVIAATNKDLQKNINEKKFRPDLFYRLNVFPINLPPLRERRQDIKELVKYFLHKFSHVKNRIMTIDQEALDILSNYSWPGNIRELENIVERVIIISRSDMITKDDLPKELLKESNPDIPIKPMKEAIHEFKKDMVIRVLREAKGKKSRAAEMLNLPRSNFSRLLKSLEVQ